MAKNALNGGELDPPPAPSIGHDLLSGCAMFFPAWMISLIVLAVSLLVHFFSGFVVSGSQIAPPSEPPLHRPRPSGRGTEEIVWAILVAVILGLALFTLLPASQPGSRRWKART